MNLFLDKHQLLLKELISQKVDFIVIGGYSVIFYGYKRTTGDVDLWLKPDNVNKTKLVSVLEKLNFNSEDLKTISNLDFSKHFTFSIWEEPEQVDFINYISMVNYNEADKEKVIAEVDGMALPFIHFNHLVLSKINTGRLKDKADVEELQKIQNFGKDKRK